MNAGMMMNVEGRRAEARGGYDTGTLSSSERPPRMLESIETKLRANGQDLAGLVGRLEGALSRIYGEPSAAATSERTPGPANDSSFSSIASAIADQDALIKRLYMIVERVEGL